MMIEVLQSFLRTVQEFPGRYAVVDHDGERFITYGELDEYSGRVAAYLKSLGVQRESLVAISLEKGMEFVAVQIAVMKCGAAFVPLSDSMGKDRISLVLEDCKPAVVFDTGHWEKAMRSEPLPVEDWADPDEHDLAFIIYTSGSTGNPKGVVEEYGAYRYTMVGSAEIIKSDPFLIPYCQSGALTCANIAPVTFSAYLINFTIIIAMRGTHYLVSDGLLRNPAAYIQFLIKHQIQVTFVTASLAKAFISIPNLPIKMLVVSSERVSDICTDKFIMYNVYCCTELMSSASHFKIDKAYPNTPIGKGYQYVDLVLYDNDAVSEKEGEICLSLPYFRGYLNQKEETEKMFVNVDGKRRFRTGDIARRDENGLLYILGRADEMVKVNGNRVEPAEVETALKKVLETNIVAVKPFEHDGKKQLCAYYQKDAAVPEDQIRAALKPLLPLYMIPSRFMWMEKMPHNANGKIDKLSLPVPPLDLGRAVYVPPRTELEKKLCEAFREVLGENGEIGEVGIDDDFMLLGGESISAMELMVDCKMPLLTVQMIYENRTVRNIASALEKRMGEKAACPEGACGMHRERLPLTLNQRYFVDFQNKYPGSLIYNYPIRFVLSGNVDAERMCAALKAVVKSHPALYTVIEKEGDAYVQYQKDSIVDSIEVEHFPEQELRDVVSGFVQPFDFDGTPLCRTRLVEAGGNLSLLLDMHHGLVDGFSWNILLSEIERAYGGEAFDDDGYRGYVNDELAYEGSAAFGEDMSRFDSMYGDAEYLYVPGKDFDRPNVDAKVVKEIPSGDEISEFCRKRHVGKNEFYICATVLAIARYNGGGNVAFTWTWNGRSDLRFMRTVGLLIRDLPVAIRLSPEMKVSEVLGECERQVLFGIAHGRCSYGMAQMGGEEDQLCFMYQGDMYDVDANEIAVRCENLEIPSQAANNILDVELCDGADGAEVLLDYDGGKYSAESMEKFARLIVDSAGMILKTAENPALTMEDVIRS